MWEVPGSVNSRDSDHLHHRIDRQCVSLGDSPDSVSLSYVAWGRRLRLSGPQFLHPRNGDEKELPSPGLPAGAR